MKNIKKTQTITLAYIGAILSLVGVLIFMILPSSAFANDISHPAKDAVWTLLASPIAVLCGSVVFMVAFLKDFGNWSDFLSGGMVKGATVIFACTSIFNVAVTTSYFVSQYKLGFVAPFDGLIYESLSIICVVIAILQVIFATLAAAGIIRNQK